MQANFDAKKYACGPWLGEQGGPFDLIFKPAFETVLRSKAYTDNFASLHQHFVSETSYGARNGPPHPAGAGLAALGVQSQMAARTRDETGYSLIIQLVGYTQVNKEKIEAHRANVLTGSPTVAATLADAL